jgi:hypothetical protein
MIGRMVLCLALVCGAGAASAQGLPDCTLYKVNTSVLNISKDANSEIYKDALFDGDIVCVTRVENINGSDWGYISHRLRHANATTLVGGWSPLRDLQKIFLADAQAHLAGAAPPAGAPAAGIPGAGAMSAPAAPPPQATIRPEDVLRFDQPIPFGPFPVNGHSIKEIFDTTPLFPPIEGLEDALWQKKCTECHKWNQARLCDQGATYVKAPRNVLRVPHPFGGAEKLALMRWAKSGCQ